MKTLVKDFFRALFMGLIVPVILLSFAVGLTQKEEGAVPIFAAEAETEHYSHPMLLRNEDGNTVPMNMEDYLVGVVLAEMPASFESEALKAQAVAARTFTGKAYLTGGKHGDGSVCTDPRCCQAYRTEADYLLKGGTEERLNKVREAVRETAGWVIQYDGALIEATYYACSGGRSESAVEVWGSDYPYLRSVESPGEEEAAHYEDVFSFSYEELADALERPVLDGTEEWIGEITYTSGGGVESIRLGETLYTGTQIRKLLNLPSTAFSIVPTEDGVQIHTSGYGHRVGMSQYGANAMAERGCGWQEILRHYYPGTEMVLL